MPFFSELVGTGLLFFYIARATSPPVTLVVGKSWERLLHCLMTFTHPYFWLLRTISSSKVIFEYQEAKVYLLVPSMSFASVTHFDLSMIKHLLKKQLVKAVTSYLFLCFSSSTPQWTCGPFLGCEALSTSRNFGMAWAVLRFMGCHGVEFEDCQFEVNGKVSMVLFDIH